MASSSNKSCRTFNGKVGRNLIMTKYVLVFITSLVLSTQAMSQDIAKGQRGFKKCSTCHTIEEGGKNKIGPNLYGFWDRGTASVENFRYSKNFIKWAEENPMWTPELMDVWLTNSKGMIRGTKMIFKEKKESRRADIIAYLQSVAK